LEQRAEEDWNQEKPTETHHCQISAVDREDRRIVEEQLLPLRWG